MSGSLNALAMPGIGASSPTNALAPLLPPSTGLDPAQAQQWMLQQGQPTPALPQAPQQQGLTPQQQYAAMLQLMQVQQAQQQQQAAAQAKAFQQQQEFWQSSAGRANEGGAGGSADHGGADSGVI